MAKFGGKPTQVINNNRTLRADLLECYNQLRLGKIGIKEAREIANIAGKAVSSAKAQLDYNAMIGAGQRTIDFFED